MLIKAKSRFIGLSALGFALLAACATNSEPAKSPLPALQVEEPETLAGPHSFGGRKRIDRVWTRPTLASVATLTRADGSSIEVGRGVTWVQIVGSLDQIG